MFAFHVYDSSINITIVNKSEATYNVLVVVGVDIQVERYAHCNPARYTIHSEVGGGHRVDVGQCVSNHIVRGL